MTGILACDSFLPCRKSRLIGILFLNFRNSSISIIDRGYVKTLKKFSENPKVGGITADDSEASGASLAEISFISRNPSDAGKNRLQSVFYSVRAAVRCSIFR